MERFEDLLDENSVKQKRLTPGDRVQATIAGISGESIFLDIGGKSEGVLDAAELRGEDGTVDAEPGDTLSVYFLAQRNGELIFTARLGAGQTTPREIEDAYHSGIPVKGQVTEEVKGGFSVSVAGQRCFCPYSQMDIRRIESAEEYLEKTFDFRVIEFGNSGRNIIVSARAILEEQREQARQHLIDVLHVGDRVSGVVTSLRDFGAFVDLGGVDGLIPISELAWGQTERVTDVLSLGQKVDVVIKSLDWDRDRISLSLRDTLENPWDSVMTSFPVGSHHVGRVSRLAQFGAFVTLTPGVDGLLHISKLGAGRRIVHPREVLETGQEISVRIENIDQEKQRISLAPEDYAREETDADAEHQLPPATTMNTSMGTLGDLLKAQLKGNKKNQ
ncbi:MAG: 30S ribosomal protein S1 [Desulfobulbus propionicus]|nr:MAG: 30S ribosomal protein S1 [Desulfobulbus propionicus]